jgi:cell division septation protein DedD
MNPLLEEDDDDLQRTERELTLSTGTILAIFLVLVLLCGAFFGFGYKMGSRGKTPLPVASTAGDGAEPSTDFSGFKPAAGSPAGSNAAAPAPAAADSSNDSSATSEPAPATVNPATSDHAAAPAVETPEQPAAAGSYVVQVAAVSHEEDAQLLVNALKAKGYPVSAHTESQDKFFHIQVGPYTSMKDASAAKQRLVADGYQPIIK